MDEASAPSRRDLMPASAVPLAYFACAHVGLSVALAVLTVRPDVPGGFFLHPRMVGLVHLVTLAWLSGSILGAFHIVAPLALRLPMPGGRSDWAAWAAFELGTVGMVAQVWMADYDGMAWAAVLVVSGIGWVAARAGRGLVAAAVPGAVKLHVALAFGNIFLAAAFGILMGFDRSRGFLGVTPLVSAYAHAHLAAVGWVAMMVVGLGYRLIPMFVPAPPPRGPRLGLSALFLECGILGLVVGLFVGSTWIVVAAALIICGIVTFALQIRTAVKHRLPRPPALPSRDWSTRQTHVALLWLVVAAVAGLLLSIGVPPAWTLPLMWLYGTSGLVGFLAQIVVGIQGRLVPMYAWYRACAARAGTTPERSANELPSAEFARAIFLTWSVGVPILAFGLATSTPTAIAGASALLLCGVVTNAAYVVHLVRAAHLPRVTPGAAG